MLYLAADVPAREVDDLAARYGFDIGAEMGTVPRVLRPKHPSGLSFIIYQTLHKTVFRLNDPPFEGHEELSTRLRLFYPDTERAVQQDLPAFLAYLDNHLPALHYAMPGGEPKAVSSLLESYGLG